MSDYSWNQVLFEILTIQKPEKSTGLLKVSFFGRHSFIYHSKAKYFSSF
jgi:hypothetical protein